VKATNTNLENGQRLIWTPKLYLNIPEIVKLDETHTYLWPLQVTPLQTPKQAQ